MSNAKRRRTLEEECTSSNKNKLTQVMQHWDECKSPTSSKMLCMIENTRDNIKDKCGWRTFPNEIWCKILSYLAKEELKKLSVICKAMRSLVNELLWGNPSFKGPLSPEDLNLLKHLPIKQLCTKRLKIRRSLIAARRFKEIFDEMPKLKQVHVSCDHHWIGFRKQSISMKTLQIIAPYVTSINLSAIVTRKDSFASDLIAIEFPRLHSVTIKRHVISFSLLSTHDLRLLMKLPITRIHIGSLQGDLDIVNSRLTYPHFALFSEMKHLKEIVLDSGNIEDDQMRVLIGLQKKGVVLVRDRLFKEL